MSTDSTFICNKSGQILAFGADYSKHDPLMIKPIQKLLKSKKNHINCNSNYTIIYTSGLDEDGKVLNFGRNFKGHLGDCDLMSRYKYGLIHLWKKI
jgi:hypothetical protein